MSLYSFLTGDLDLDADDRPAYVCVCCHEAIAASAIWGISISERGYLCRRCASLTVVDASALSAAKADEDDDGPLPFADEREVE